MTHKKQSHIKSISVCREALNGTCRFGKINCWYNHENVNENEEVFVKLFDMMEKFTQRIVKIKNNL